MTHGRPGEYFTNATDVTRSLSSPISIHYMPFTLPGHFCG